MLKIAGNCNGGSSQIYVWQNDIINLAICFKASKWKYFIVSCIKIMTQHRNKCTSEKSVASFFWLLSKESFTHQLKPPVVHQLFHQLKEYAENRPNDALGTLVKLFICYKIFKIVKLYKISRTLTLWDLWITLWDWLNWLNCLTGESSCYSLTH